jgi:hypothetical protein
MRVLAIAAHPDDIEWLCGGTLALCAQRGDEIFIAIAMSVPVNPVQRKMRLLEYVTKKLKLLLR